MTTRHPDFLIIGAGAIGAAIAHALARHGAAVTVLERDHPGGATSRAAAGMLTPTGEGIPPGPLRDLSLHSLRLYPDLARRVLDEAGVDIELSMCGVLLPAFTDEMASAYQARASQEGPDGLRWLHRADALKHEPLLAESLRGALFHPTEGHVNGSRLTDGLTQAAARLGAAFHYGVEVSGLLRDSNHVLGVRAGGSDWHAGTVVLAAGAWSGDLAAQTGISLDIHPVRGQTISLRLVPQPIKHVIYGHPGYLVPRRDGTLTLGATQEWAGFDLRATAGNVRMLLETCRQVLPALDNATFLGVSTGFRPGSPDESPILGPVSGLTGLAVAIGHFRHGILLAPATGEFMADYLMHNRAAPLKPFSTDRPSLTKA
jgi:glycine oxidase